MNAQLRRVSLIVVLMFVSLMASSTWIQVITAETLRKDPHNTRTMYDNAGIERGAILVGNQAIAQSEPSDDEYKFHRTYPQAALYAPVTGYLTVTQGSTGLEAALNDELTGKADSQFFETLNRIVTGQQPQGDSARLTLDPVVQQAAWDALEGRRGAVVALEPATGRILAMVSNPSYDPNTLTSTDPVEVQTAYDALLAEPDEPLINRAIGGALNHPGSTFKLVVTAAALETGKYTAESQFPNTGEYQLPQSTAIVRNSWLGPCGPGATTTIATSLMMSCNTTFAQLGVELGDETLGAMARSFGFETPLSIPLPVTPSIFPSDMNDAETALSSIGQQDVRASPLQMAMVSAAIANKGVLMKPGIVQEILKASDLSPTAQFTPEVFSTPMSPETAKSLTEMMIQVVSSPSGTARPARIEGVEVAGKTGTAENGTEADGTDRPYILWFTGFAPAADPKVAVAVVLENGGGMGLSGTSDGLAAPIGKKVIEAVLNQ